MSAMKSPHPVSLFFAVLDGSDPKTWSLYGKCLPEFMKDASGHAKPNPKRVEPALLRDYNVNVELMWNRPEELREERSLDGVVGVIIDAFPKADTETDRAQKIQTLREHVRHLGGRQDKPKSLCTGLKYSIWLVTDGATDVAAFKASVAETAGHVMGPDRIDPQVFEDGDWLFRHLKTYIEHVYYELGRGCYDVDFG